MAFRLTGHQIALGDFDLNLPLLCGEQPNLISATMKTALKQDSLGLAQSIIIGVAGSAPSFSISATMVALIAAVGVLAPASLLYCGLLMIGIVLAYMHLNKRRPNSGASYAWVTEIFGTNLGFFAGWTLLVASALFMASASIPAASATLLLLQSPYADSQLAITICATIWLCAITLLVVKGIGLTAKVQIVMTLIELLILFGISLMVIIQFGGAALHHFSWQHFALSAFTLSSFANGAVIALFFFWGWDVAINLTEETKNPEKSPGYGIVGAILIILAAFTAFASISLMSLSDDEITQSGTNIIFAVAEKIIPKPWSYVAVLALILSTIGTIETSMLQFSRTMFSKARDGIFHQRWSEVHPQWKTPYAATFLIACFGIITLLLSLSSESIAVVMAASINIIGVQAAYYYGLAGFACAWYFRKEAVRSVGLFITMLLWPTVSAIALWSAAILAMLSFDKLTFTIALGSLLLGVIPLVRFKLRQHKKK